MLKPKKSAPPRNVSQRARGVAIWPPMPSVPDLVPIAIRENGRTRRLSREGRGCGTGATAEDAADASASLTEDDTRSAAIAGRATPVSAILNEAGCALAACSFGSAEDEDPACANPICALNPATSAKITHKTLRLDIFIPRRAAQNPQRTRSSERIWRGIASKYL